MPPLFFVIIPAVGLVSVEKHSIESIIQVLNSHQVRYLIVGGLAVVAHGYVRFTADLDLLLAMETANLSRAVEALQTLNYRSRAPVEFKQFIDPAQRKQWIEEKGLTVFSLFSPDHPATEIDLFVDPPLIFADAYLRAKRMDVASGVTATFCSLDDLIDLKSKAGRPRDRDDIAQLQKLREDNR
jgi:predicted nucleotidyltransferase